MPEVDQSKVLFSSNTPAFKNNNIYTGTGTISGTVSAGISIFTVTVPLGETPDMVQIMLNGPTDTVFGDDPRPGTGWFRDGYVWVRGDNHGAGYDNYLMPFKMNTYISGSSAIIEATLVSSISPVLTLTSTQYSYRIIDYSVF